MKKTIVIIAILAVVGFCLYWFVFRNKNTEESAGTGSGTGAGNTLNGGVLTDKTSTDSIVDSLSLANNVTSVVKASAKNAMQNIEAKTDWGKDILDKASSNGVNSAQQCVMSALWLAYDTNRLLTYNEYVEARDKVKAL